MRNLKPKHVESTNQASLALLAMDKTSDCVYWLDRAGRFIYANEAATLSLGYTKAEFLTMTVPDIDPDYSRKKWNQRWKELRLKKKLVLEVVHRAKNGRLIDYEVSANHIELANREYNCAFARDITERKRAENALRHSENRYRELFDHINSGVAVYEVVDNGKDFIFKDFNRAGEKTDNVRREDLIGKSIYKVRPGIKQFGLTDTFKKVWQTGRPAIHPVALYQDNRLRGWYENFVYKLPSGEIVAVFDNITERKLMEEEFRIQEARLANALKIASLGNWEYDVQRDEFTFNDNFYALFRTTAKEMGGYIMSSQDYANTFIHPDDRFMVASEIKKALETSDPFFVRKLEHRIVYADGEPGFITVRYFVVKDKNGKTVKTYGINQDITQRIQTQEALQRELEVNSALAALYTPLVSPATTLHEIAYAVLEHAQRLTRSERGYVSVIDPDTGRNVGYTRTKILPKQYTISGDDNSFEFPRNPDGAYTGLWGHSLNAKQAFFTNTPSKDPSSKFTLKRFLSVPVLLENELVGQISLANSGGDYTDRDLSSVKRLAEFYALAIQRKRFEDKIKHSLDEKVLLLKEIHHRIKNNLQIVISLLHLQTSYLKEEKICDYFKDNESRIRSMALIHEKLYQSGEFSEVDFADYIKRLAHDLLQVYRINNSMVNLKLYTEKIPLKIDKAVPCGLLLNELVLNSLKHAFKGGRDNTISITLKKTADQKILLDVADNGIGLPAKLNLSNPATLGFSLIVSLSCQLNGTISIGNKNGTRFRIIFES